MIRRQSAFTLIELLVAMTVLSMMSVIAYSGMSSILRNDRAVQENERNLKRLQKAFVFIERDLRQVVLRPRNGGLSEPLPPVQSGNALVEGLIEFSRDGNDNPLEAPRSTLQRIRYVLEDEKLQRWSWSLVDHMDAEPVKTAMLDKVTEASFDVIDSKGETSQNWSSEDTLPSGVEIKITHERWGEIRRVLPFYY